MHNNPLCIDPEWPDLNFWAKDVYVIMKDLVELHDDYDPLEIEAFPLEIEAFIEEHRLFGADEKNLHTFELARQRSCEIRRVVDGHDEKGDIGPIQLRLVMDILNRIDRDIRIAKSAILQRCARRGIFAPDKETVLKLESLGRSYMNREKGPCKFTRKELRDLDKCMTFFHMTNKNVQCLPFSGAPWFYDMQDWAYRKREDMEVDQKCKAAAAWCALMSFPQELRRLLFKCVVAIEC